MPVHGDKNQLAAMKLTDECRFGILAKARSTPAFVLSGRDFLLERMWGK